MGSCRTTNTLLTLAARVGSSCGDNVSRQGTTKPENLGLSTERLRRIHNAMQRHIDAHDISGAVTFVARRGRIVHFEAHGLMDLDAKKPMRKDALFWIASMSKPVTAVAILTLLEEGRLRLDDPVSKFIPELLGMKVAGLQEPSATTAAGAPAPRHLIFTW